MKNKKALLRREADKLWSIAYLKDKCEVCGNIDNLQGHHFYYKGSFPYVRYSKENCITLCIRCHSLLHHQDCQRETEKKIIKVRGQKWYKNLNLLSKNKSQSYLTENWYKEHIKTLKQSLKD